MKNKITGMLKFVALVVLLLHVTIFGAAEVYAADTTEEWKGSYDELVDYLLDKYMTCTEVEVSVDKDFYDKYINVTLLNDMLNTDNGVDYDLSKRFEAMQLKINQYVIFYNGEVEYRYRISLNNTDYNSLNKEEYNEFLDSIINKLSLSTKSEFEKIYLLHEYILRTYEYTRNMSDVTPVGKMNTRVNITCGQYSILYKDLLERVRVKSILIDGSNKNGDLHCWNLVRYKDKWYYTDVTWDDSSEDKHEYFMVSTDSIEKDHDIANCNKRSLENYEIAKNSLQYANVPYIIDITITDSNKIKVLSDVDQSTQYKIVYNGKEYKEGQRLSGLEDNKVVKIRFSNSGNTVYRYRIKEVKMDNTSRFLLLPY